MAKTEDKAKPASQEAQAAPANDGPTEAALLEYASILQAAGELKPDFDLNGLSPEDRADFEGQYNAWYNAGAPRPQMPEVKEEVKQIGSVYRIKQFGTEYLYYKVKGGEVPVGVDMIPVYREETDEQGHVIKDETTLIKWDRKYTIPYTQEQAREVLERCQRESKDPRAFVVIGKETFLLNDPDNFLAPYESIVQKAARREYI